MRALPVVREKISLFIYRSCCLHRALWDTSVRYNLEEEPRRLEKHVSKDMLNSQFSASALGGTEGKIVVALASGRHIFFHAVGEGTGKQIESIGAAHGSSGTSILSMEVRGEAGQLSESRIWREAGVRTRRRFCFRCDMWLFNLASFPPPPRSDISL